MFSGQAIDHYSTIHDLQAESSHMNNLALLVFEITDDENLLIAILHRIKTVAPELKIVLYGGNIHQSGLVQAFKNTAAQSQRQVACAGWRHVRIRREHGQPQRDQAAVPAGPLEKVSAHEVIDHTSGIHSGRADSPSC